jgi:hypothetical protein
MAKDDIAPLHRCGEGGGRVEAVVGEELFGFGAPPGGDGGEDLSEAVGAGDDGVAGIEVDVLSSTTDINRLWLTLGGPITDGDSLPRAARVTCGRSVHAIFERMSV